MQNNYVRKIFLEEFVKTIIRNKYREENPAAKQELIEELSKDDYILSSKDLSKSAEERITTAFETSQPLPIKRPVILPPVNQIKGRFPPNIQNLQRQMMKPNIPNLQKPQNIQNKSPLQPAQQEFTNKIAPFIADPGIQSVECKGPGKPVVILKNGLIQLTNIILSQEEIETIMKDFSNKTRIPLMQGLFKAAFNNLMITAVISEFVGTRFIVEKRRPF